MSSEWQPTSLGAICSAQGGAIQTGPFGSQLHTSDYKEIGVPVVMPTNIGDGGIAVEGIARIGQEDVERLQQHKLQLDDIVFSRRGDVTKNALVRAHEAGWLCGTGCLKVRLGDQSIADAKFISYCLRLPDTKEWLIRHAVGGTMPNLNTGILSAVPITLPPLSVQLEIAEILGALDDRITLLRETNATLEAIAQALFKSWFVDFDPVRAKAEGCQPEGMNAPTAALFPDSFEESELGLVPKGWEIGQLQDLLVLQRGFDLPAAERTEGQYPLIAASGPSGTHHIAMAKGPGVITGRSGVLGKVFLTLEDYWPLNTTLWVKEFKRATPCFAFQLLKLLDFGSFNAGSAVPTLNRNHIHSLKYVLPPVELVGAYEDAALVIHERVLENNRQAQTLTQLRDTVLPRLISGQLRLPEAMAQISESTAQELQYAN
ncbi:restriction endonuclease subunit S [Pseudomonas sediminis]|uniref:restriction endonuclease subunit S n=1 Tax=Pseudomonas sediminis TaxID=1691904 RepID=UPI0031CC520C